MPKRIVDVKLVYVETFAGIRGVLIPDSGKPYILVEVEYRALISREGLIKAVIDVLRNHAKEYGYNVRYVLEAHKGEL